jgi:hypothetical protein
VQVAILIAKRDRVGIEDLATLDLNDDPTHFPGLIPARNHEKQADGKQP